MQSNTNIVVLKQTCRSKVWVDPKTNTVHKKILSPEKFHRECYFAVKLNQMENFASCTTTNEPEMTITYPHYANGNLSEYLSLGKLNASQFEDIFNQLYTALISAYKKYGFLHNDLHPKNIVLDSNLTPYFIDFELSADSTCCITKSCKNITDNLENLSQIMHFVYRKTASKSDLFKESYTRLKKMYANIVI